jgi:hypothetical protein
VKQFIGFKKAYDSFKQENLYNILVQFGIPKETCSDSESISQRGCGNFVTGNFVTGSFVTVILTPVILSPKYEQIGNFVTRM